MRNSYSQQNLQIAPQLRRSVDIRPGQQFKPKVSKELISVEHKL